MSKKTEMKVMRGWTYADSDGNPVVDVVSVKKTRWVRAVTVCWLSDYRRLLRKVRELEASNKAFANENGRLRHEIAKLKQIKIEWTT